MDCGLGDGATATAVTEAGAEAGAAAGAAAVAGAVAVAAAAAGLKGSWNRGEILSHPSLCQSLQIVSCDTYLQRTAARGWWRWRPHWPVCWQKEGKVSA